MKGVGLLHAQAMLEAGEAARPLIGGIFRGRCRDQRCKLGVALHKTRFELREETEHVLGNEDLAVTGGRGADADRPSVSARLQ